MSSIDSCIPFQATPPPESNSMDRPFPNLPWSTRGLNNPHQQKTSPKLPADLAYQINLRSTEYNKSGTVFAYSIPRVPFQTSSSGSSPIK